jgi:hypothetical protein
MTEIKAHAGILLYDEITYIVNDKRAIYEMEEKLPITESWLPTHRREARTLENNRKMGALMLYCSHEQPKISIRPSGVVGKVPISDKQGRIHI